MLPLAGCVKSSKLLSFSGSHFDLSANQKVGPVCGLKMERPMGRKKGGVGSEGKESGVFCL